MMSTYVNQSLAATTDLQPRQTNMFPTALGGKAFDTALVLAWLQDELSHGSQAKHGCTICMIST